MPRKPAQTDETSDEEKIVQLPNIRLEQNDEENLTRMLAAVLDYLSDEDIEEIDIEYLFDHTEGLREWWKHYQENNRKKIEEEIRDSLSDLSLEELQKIREQIKEK